MLSPPQKTAPGICILIPAYQEEASIAAVIHETRDFCPDADIIVIDDGSSDATSRAAREAGAVVLEHVRNQGKGAALRTGFDYATQHNYELAVTIDADGQHAPSDIPAFLQARARTGASVLIGNRMDNLTGMPPLRRFVNRFMSALLSRQMGQYVPDTQCGFRLYHRAAFPYNELTKGSQRFAGDSEVLLRLSLRGFHIGSVPIQTIYGVEKSKINPFLDTIRFFRMLRLFKKIKKEYPPR